MLVSAINGTEKGNNLPSFGHSFRVCICLKDANGIGDIFVSPASNRKLYRHLNSKIVNWLNEEYYSILRKALNITKKVQKREPVNDLHKQMVEELKKIDSDYANIGLARSVYNGGRLGYIATGADVPIIEQMKGIKHIGLAKADSMWYNGVTNSDYVKELSKLVQENARNYVQNSNVILRSKNDKEIMLRAVFKESGKTKSGAPLYELDRYEFHENKTNPTLLPVTESFKRYKHSAVVYDAITKTIQSHADRTIRSKVHHSYIDKISRMLKKEET